MNEHFISKVATIRSSMHKASFPLMKLFQIKRGKNYKMQLHHVSLSKVGEVSGTPSNSRNTSVDELDNFSMKLAADFVAQPLSLTILSTYP